MTSTKEAGSSSDYKFIQYVVGKFKSMEKVVGKEPVNADLDAILSN